MVTSIRSSNQLLAPLPRFSCSDCLKRLVVSIRNAIASCFKCFFPCFFRKPSVEPKLNSKVSVSPKTDKTASPLPLGGPLSTIPEERPSQISSSVATVVLEEPDSQLPSSNLEIVPSEDIESDSGSDWDPDELLKAEFPDLSPRTRVFRDSPLSYIPPDPIRRGTFSVPEDPRVKWFVLLEGIETISTDLLKNQTISSELELDSFIKRGIHKSLEASVNLKGFEENRTQVMEPCDLVTGVFSDPRKATLRFDEDPDPYGTNYSTRVEEMLGALQVTATKHNNFMAAILFKGERGSENPMGIIFHESKFYVLGREKSEDSILLYSFGSIGTARNWIVRMDPMPVNPPHFYWIEAMVLKGPSQY